MHINKQADAELLKALKNYGIDDTGMKLAMKMRDAMSSLIDKGYHVDLGTDGEGVDLTISVGGVE